jgi:hypothetical protein
MAARAAATGYIRDAREAGHTWHEIGDALGLVPGGDAEQEGATIAEAAYTYTAGRHDPDEPWRPRTFQWRCRPCDQAISDHGLSDGPPYQMGPADNCPRLSAAMAEWDAQLEAEP